MQDGYIVTGDTDVTFNLVCFMLKRFEQASDGILGCKPPGATVSDDFHSASVAEALRAPRGDRGR
jgi:hypothetical protein